MANTGNTQQQINYGAAVNDGQGDPLRTAFIKTDDNFDNIWLAGPVGSNITITNNTVQVNDTNGNLILSPNGIGVIQTNSRVVPRLNNTYDLGSTTQKYRTGYFGIGGLSVDGNVNITGNLTAGNISYTSNVFVGDLEGSVFADDSTIMVDAIDNVLYAGRAAISGNVSATYFIGNGSQLTGLAATYGNANVVANLAALGSNPISTTGNVTANYFVGNGRQLTGVVSSYGNANVAVYLPTYTGLLNGNSLNITRSGNTWSMIDGALNFPTGALWYSDISTNDEFITSNVDGYLNFQTFDSTSNVATELHMEHGLVHINIYNGVNQQWEFNEDGTTHFPGDLLPQANLGGNLGSSAFQWQDLWVSNNTIYINSVPLRLTAGNVLTVNGNAVLQNNSNSTISTTGNITANYFVGNGSQLTGISTANTGNVTFSGEAVIGTGTSNTVSGLYLAPDPVSLTNDLYLRVRGNIYDEPTHIHFDTGNNAYYNQYIGDDNKYILLANTGNVVVNTNNYAGNTAQWTFGVDGTLILPQGGIVYETSIPGGTLAGNTIALTPQGGIDADQQLLIYPTAAPGTDDNHLHLTTGNLYNTELFLGNDNLYVKLANTGNVVVNSNDAAGNAAQWTFDTTGNLTLPGNTFAVNYANGNPVTFSGGSGNTGNVTFDDQVVVGTGSQDGSGGLYLAPGTESVGNLQYWRVRGGDVATHMHLDTGNNAYFDQYFGDDGKYVKLANTGNVVIGSDNANGNSAQWTFGTDGNLTTPSNLVIGPGPGSGSSIFQYNEGLQILGEGANSVVQMGWTANTSAPDSVTTIAMNYPGGGEGNVLIAVGNNATTVNYWLFNNTGNLTLPGGSQIRPLGANLDIIAGTGAYVNLITADESSSVGVDNSGGYIVTAGGTWDFDTTGNLTAPGNVSAAGNILTGSQVIASGVIESGTGFSTGGYLSVDGSADLHNTTVTGNLSATGNVTAQNFIGNISITGNVIGTQPNVTLVAGSYDWTFDNTGNLTLPGNTFAVNYADNTLVDVVTRFEDVWTVPTGNSTQSFTVDGNNSYQMWLEGNIPNGIIAWNATVTVTNTNVPVIGQQFAWNYEGGGNILMFNSIPAQIIGTAGAISNAEPAVGNTTNVFSFGINNASGNVANVRYGWIKIS